MLFAFLENCSVFVPFLCLNDMFCVALRTKSIIFALYHQCRTEMITLHHDKVNHIIRAMEDGREVGNVQYDMRGNVMMITHTYAHVAGRGIGRLLVLSAIDYARGHVLKILPLCSYAKALMERSGEYRTMMPESE